MILKIYFITITSPLTNLSGCPCRHLCWLLRLVIVPLLDPETVYAYVKFVLNTTVAKIIHCVIIMPLEIDKYKKYDYLLMKD